MKKIGTILTLGLLTLSFHACTNDEGDPEFEILTPNEETEQVKKSKKESTTAQVPLPGE